MARNPPIRPREFEKLRAHDIKRVKLVRPIIPKTDAATIEIHPMMKIAVGYFDSVATIISATPIMILTTTAKTCRPTDFNLLRSKLLRLNLADPPSPKITDKAKCRQKRGIRLAA